MLLLFDLAFLLSASTESQDRKVSEYLCVCVYFFILFFVAWFDWNQLVCVSVCGSSKLIQELSLNILELNIYITNISEPKTIWFDVIT